MPTTHPTKGLTGRRSDKIKWAAILLRDQDTLRTYEEYARESAYEAEEEHPPPANTNDRRPRNQDTRASHQRTAQPTDHGHAGTSSGATGMDVDPDPEGRGTPPGTPFDEDFTPSTTRGRGTADPPASARTENYYTPLSEEQAAAEAAAAAQAAADEAEAEAAAEAAAAFVDNLAADHEAAAAAEAAAAKAQAEAEACAEAEAAARAETMAREAASAAAAAASGSAPPAPPLTAATGATEAGARAVAADQARQTEAALKAQMAGGDAGGSSAPRQARDVHLPLDTDDWELSEGGLPEGSTLSGSKGLMEDYPEDEANSKKTKKTNTGKGKKNKNKA